MTALHLAHDKRLSFCKTLIVNDEGDDPSRVGATMDPLMDGMEQLDTVISFRDGGSGIARELQRPWASIAFRAQLDASIPRHFELVRPILSA